MSLDTFLPQGNSQLISATTTASVGLQISSGNIQGVRIRTSALAYVAFGSSTVTALAPTTSTPANGIWLNSAAVEKFTVPPNCYVSFITSAAAGALCTITPGFGL